MTDQPAPTPGRIVLYKLSEQDASAISSIIAVGKGNRHVVGDVYPAIVVRSWPHSSSPLANLQVLFDGQGTYWATSRAQGDDAGQWQWPARA